MQYVVYPLLYVSAAISCDKQKLIWWKLRVNSLIIHVFVSVTAAHSHTSLIQPNTAAQIHSGFHLDSANMPPKAIP